MSKYEDFNLWIHLNPQTFLILGLQECKMNLNWYFQRILVSSFRLE